MNEWNNRGAMKRGVQGVQKVNSKLVFGAMKRKNNIKVLGSVGKF